LVDVLLSPAPALHPYVEGYWVRSGLYEPARKVRVMADACTKLIFELTPMPWGSCYVIGTQTSPIIVMLAGEVDRIGVRFRPGAASFFLEHSLDGLAGRLTALGQLGIAEGEAMLARLREAGSQEERAKFLDQWLLSRLPGDDPERSDMETIMEVARLLRAGLAPPAIAAAANWSERRLQRVCRHRFGAPAASLHRLYRFDLLQARLRGVPVELARLAAELGYSDQAHMARDFRHFAHTTMSAFLRERATVGNLQDAGGWLPVLRDLQEEA
jgi:AraC-like DNA-binding protein